MIKASCIPCGADLGTFRDRQEYLEWRSQTESCESCGAHLDTSLFTSYVKGEPLAEEEEEEEQPLAEEAGEKTQTEGSEFPGSIFGRKKKKRR